MLMRRGRGAATTVLAPVAAVLLRLGVRPDAVTVVGTVGVVAGALLLFPRGELWWGSVVVGLFALCDVVDGVMARLSGTAGPWGGYLDSTLDRVADGAVLGGLAVWFLGTGGRPLDGYLALGCLVVGSVVSYARARAGSFGWEVTGGLAERADRLVWVLVATGLTGLFLPAWVLTAVLALVLAASTVTVAQRMTAARRQALLG
ncbi:phosphatidylinositol phosphate synthase [Ornithinimicrobium avium]|uniref:Phosphatidylinositol phosphate synthase n=1 Tax=Ornithinimicrobium avium TaxID=2283195 RepID=A0A345NJU8_9MICO|nr:CDP-alcohol phosphatidyltransferase family protein [Ornithinimicrobium avium]AXH95306.1 CDP-alcohol phosphatidyltransferase family protein [Ornithinimicrobium avium]